MEEKKRKFEKEKEEQKLFSDAYIHSLLFSSRSRITNQATYQPNDKTIHSKELSNYIRHQNQSFLPSSIPSKTQTQTLEPQSIYLPYLSIHAFIHSRSLISVNQERERKKKVETKSRISTCTHNIKIRDYLSVAKLLGKGLKMTPTNSSQENLLFLESKCPTWRSACLASAVQCQIPRLSRYISSWPCRQYIYHKYARLRRRCRRRC